jgi:hypothetical protein
MTTAIATARGVIVTAGMSVGQACESSTISFTRTTAHRGRWNRYMRNGSRTATPAASRARSQVLRDGPCHSSARK